MSDAPPRPHWRVGGIEPGAVHLIDFLLGTAGLLQETVGVEVDHLLGKVVLEMIEIIMVRVRRELETLRRLVRVRWVMVGTASVLLWSLTLLEGSALALCLTPAEVETPAPAKMTVCREELRRSSRAVSLTSRLAGRSENSAAVSQEGHSLISSLGEAVLPQVTSGTSSLSLMSLPW